MKTDVINQKKEYILLEAECTPFGYYAISDKRETIAHIFSTSKSSKENAELFVKAVNNYDSLLSALKDVVMYLESGNTYTSVKNQFTAIAKAAIRQAEEL